MATLEEALYGLNMSPADTGYGLATQAVSQATPQLINPYGSTGQAIGIGLGSILLQSLLGYQARQQAARNTLEMNTLANQMQSFATPQERTDFIAGIEDPIQQSRLSTLATALRAQEQKNTFDVERAKQLKIAELQAAVSPEGREKQQMDLELLREQLGARLSRDISFENVKQANRLERQDRQAEISKAQTELRQKLSDAAAKNRLTAGEAESLGSDYNAAGELEKLANDLATMSEFDAKASLSSVLGSQIAQQTGLYARYNRLKADFRNKLFGASLSGGEASSANAIFGESPFASKETTVLALRGISNQLINQAKNRLAAKQTDVPDLYNMFDSASRGEWRPMAAPAQGEDIFAGASDTTPTPAPASAAPSDAVARARAALADPNLSNEMKQRIQNKLTELGVQE
jgi:hypothetical protein